MEEVLIKIERILQNIRKELTEIVKIVYINIVVT